MADTGPKPLSIIENHGMLADPRPVSAKSHGTYDFKDNLKFDLPDQRTAFHFASVNESFPEPMHVTISPSFNANLAPQDYLNLTFPLCCR